MSSGVPGDYLLIVDQGLPVSLHLPKLLPLFVSVLSRPVASSQKKQAKKSKYISKETGRFCFYTYTSTCSSLAFSTHPSPLLPFQQALPPLLPSPRLQPR